MVKKCLKIWKTDGLIVILSVKSQDNRVRAYNFHPSDNNTIPITIFKIRYKIMKKILLMALALTGMLFMTTACSEEDTTSDLPVYNANDAGTRVSEPAWVNEVTWTQNPELVETYNSLLGGDLTLIYTGNYEYKAGMNYATGMEQDYWYHIAGANTFKNIYIIEGKMYDGSFAGQLSSLKWSEAIQADYEKAWNRYTNRSRKVYQFMLRIDGSISQDGVITINDSQHKVVDVTAMVPATDKDPAVPAHIIWTSGENLWEDYSIRDPFAGITITSRTEIVYYDSVLEGVLANIDIMQEYFKSNEVMIPGATADDNTYINLDDIRAALK